MRILFANHTAEVSGAEVALLRLLDGLSTRHEVAVACPLDGPLVDRLDAAGIERLPLPAVEPEPAPRPRPDALGLGQLIRAGIAGAWRLGDIAPT